MAHLTTALLGSLSRVFFPPSAPDLGISHSKSDPDLALHVDTHLHPASSTSVRPRPASAMAIEGYWGWGWDTEAQGTTLRRRTRTERDVGLKAPADVKLTDSPVLCQPPRPARTGTPLPIAGAPVAPAPLVDVVNTLAPERAGPTAATLLPTYTADRRDYSEPDSSFELSHSFDISLISDTSTDDSEGDGSFSFPLPPAPALVSTYGTLQRRADSEPDSSLDFSHSFDISLITDPSTSSDEYSELSDISFGAFSLTLPPQSPAHPRRPLNPATRRGLGLSRTFLEEAVGTWARDPEHLRLGVIDEELTVVNDREEPGDPDLDVYHGLGAAQVDVGGDTDTRISFRCGGGGKSKSKSGSRTRVCVDRDTISSGLKRLNPPPAPRSRSRLQAAGVPTRPASVPGHGHEARPGVWRA
ncbi:hypothetical protein DFH06DRAFT_1224362 [Mycena polygramma]|nr:hypothetical protein DFH06DRAFT_1224362 [Mycena polygramma]